MSSTFLGTIGIAGNGSWGTALAKILTDNGNHIQWWMRNSEAVDALAKRGNNPHYLSSVKFSQEQITATADLTTFWAACDTILFAVPSAYAANILSQLEPAAWEGKRIISAIKGVLPDESMLLCDFLAQKLDFDLNNFVAITGPCHAEEVAGERLSYLTFSGLDEDYAAAVSETFRNSYIYTTHNHDLWGAQYAAVLKNIYAVGAGMAHSLEYGDNFLSVYITACYREMYAFLQAHFAQAHSSNEQPDFHTSAYLGDLLVTCYSLHSRNRTFGAMVGKGYSIKAATLEMNMVAEGYYAAQGMQNINSALGISCPIAHKIFQVLWEGRKAGEMFAELQREIF